ncbi:MAG: hypothetical protein IJB16_04275, partial [Clostridia bacterium]|nr:hypothetical protein [Clostridia bacterium]
MKSFFAVIIAAAVFVSGIYLFGRSNEISADIPVFNANSTHSITEEIEFAVTTAEAAAKNEATASDVGSLGYIVVTEYISADGKTDVADEIQSIIDSNPNRTVYFPDGIYLISKPIFTPADPRKSVDLQFSNYAVIRAADNFNGEALVRLGGKDAANDTHTPGSNYSLTGGVLDARGITNGVSIDSGRETVIRNVSIKNAV